MGVGIGELEDAGIVVSWKFGLWLTLLGFIAAAALQFVPMPSANKGDEMIGPGNVGEAQVVRFTPLPDDETEDCR